MAGCSMSGGLLLKRSKTRRDAIGRTNKSSGIMLVVATW